MAYQLIIKPEAECDLEEAVDWYENRQPGLGQEFLECVEEVFNRIRVMPTTSPIARHSARLALVRRFRYVICYIFENDTVYVVSVFHSRRNPNAWHDRLN